YKGAPWVTTMEIVEILAQSDHQEGNDYEWRDSAFALRVPSLQATCLFEAPLRIPLLSFIILFFLARSNIRRLLLKLVCDSLISRIVDSIGASSWPWPPCPTTT